MAVLAVYFVLIAVSLVIQIFFYGIALLNIAMLLSLPIKFAYQKTTELAAFLIDKNGALCTYGEISAALWEDDSHMSYLKKLRADLIGTFEKIGFSNLVFTQKGMLGIDTSMLDCDYLDFRNSGSRNLPAAYHGEYMSQFPWADTTNAALWWQANEHKSERTNSSI